MCARGKQSCGSKAVFSKSLLDDRNLLLSENTLDKIPTKAFSNIKNEQRIKSTRVGQRSIVMIVAQLKP